MVLFSAGTLFNLALVATISGALGKEDSTTRIFGGEPASPGKYGYYVHLSQGCAGSLIASDVVVTAAHCVDVSDYNLTVSVGAYESQIGETRRVVANILHPSYRPSITMDYNIILLKLDRPVSNIAPVQINSNSSNPTTGDNLTIIGYLSPQSETNAATERQYDGLHQGNISALPYSACEDVFGDMWTGDATMLCAGNGNNEVQVSTCPGDAGAPLLDSYNQMVGIVSVGTSCGAKQMPGIYTRTSHFAEWMKFQACVLSNVRPSFCGPPEKTNSTSYTVTVSVNATLSPTNATTTIAQPSATDWPTNITASAGSGSTWSSTGGVAISLVTATEVPTFPNQTISLRLDIFYDAYGIETAWEFLRTDFDEVIDYKRFYTVVPVGLTSITYDKLLPGNYSFLIQDFADDGICCNFGEGYVRISQVFDDNVSDIDEKQLWYLEGNFGTQASVELELLPYKPGNTTGFVGSTATGG
jgi:secreted trypsin-like serine protease